MKKTLRRVKTLFLRYKPGGLLAAAGLYALLALLGMGCPIRYFTGISCPGCGLTRAYLSFFTLHFARAFHFHPLFLLVPVLVLFLCCKRGIFASEKVRTAGIVLIAAAFVAVYLVRLFILKSDIVTIGYPEFLIDLRNGIKFLEGLQ